MPRQKDLKRVVRSRMAKTGESYTAARSHVVAKKERTAARDAPAAPPPVPAGPEPDYAALAGMSDETIREKTGCSWKQWVAHLDYRGAAALPHREIAALAYQQMGGSGWWAQAVAVGYERIRGLRAIGQRRDGSYEANKSRTFPVAVERLFAGFTDAALRAAWLPEGVVLKRATPVKSLRLDWPDGSPVEVGFLPKGDGRSAVAVQHRKLASRERADELKAEWSARFDALAGLLGRA